MAHRTWLGPSPCPQHAVLAETVAKPFIPFCRTTMWVGGIPLIILQVRQKAGVIYPLRHAGVARHHGGVPALLGTHTEFVGVDAFRSPWPGRSCCSFHRPGDGAAASGSSARIPRFWPQRRPEGLQHRALAFPGIAGQGTITTILPLRAEFAASSILVAILRTWYPCCRAAAHRPHRTPAGPRGSIVVKKAFGIILLMVSVELFAGQHHHLFPQSIR